MTVYCTLDELKAELKASGTVDDDRVMRHAYQVSRRIDGLSGMHRGRPAFAPYYEQREFPVRKRHVNSYENSYHMGDLEWLFTIAAVTLDDTDVTSQVQQYPTLNRCFNMLRFTSFSYSWYNRYQTDTEPAYVKVTGFWGYHDDYDNAWQSVDTLQANINASVTTITVADVDGDDLYGFSPRISRGNLIMVGDEIMEVTATDTTANTATVRRWQNGTTAAAHTSGDAVATWDVEPSIKRIVARQAALLYVREGAFQVETIDGVGSISYPQDLMTEAARVISELFYG